MAVTSLWRITNHSLSALIDYAKNPEKTELGNVLEYAGLDRKTHDLSEVGGDVRKYVTTINCSSDTAEAEMLAVKRRFGKEDGTVAYHGYQSFKGWETTPEIAHEIGVKLAEQLWGSRYQVLVATHLDCESHLHNHFVINTVSFVDGKKFYRSNDDYRKMCEVSDALCREYGLSVIEHPKGKGMGYSEWRDGLSERQLTAKAAVDQAIAESSSLDEFADNMKRMGYTVDLNPNRKYWTIIGTGWGKCFRLHRLGSEYTNEQIMARLSVPIGERVGIENDESAADGDTPVDKWRGGKRSARIAEAMPAVDRAIAQSSSLDEFADNMKRMGYTVDLNPNRKHWTIIGEGWGQSIRMDRLGDEYTNERIMERLSVPMEERANVGANKDQGAERPDADAPSSTARSKRKYVRLRVRGNRTQHRRVIGLSGLYYHYCYLLGIFPRNNPRKNARYHYVLRDDLRKLDMITDETRLLVGHHIGTAEQLSSFRESCKSRIELLTERRRELYNASRTVSVRSDEVRLQKIRADIADISKELSRLRHEVKLCDDIETRSPVMKEKIRIVREDEKHAEQERRRRENIERKDERTR